MLSTAIARSWPQKILNRAHQGLHLLKELPKSLGSRNISKFGRVWGFGVPICGRNVSLDGFFQGSRVQSVGVNRGNSQHWPYISFGIHCGGSRFENVRQAL